MLLWKQHWSHGTKNVNSLLFWIGFILYIFLLFYCTFTRAGLLHYHTSTVCQQYSSAPNFRENWNGTHDQQKTRAEEESWGLWFILVFCPGHWLLTISKQCQPKIWKKWNKLFYVYSVGHRSWSFWKAICCVSWRVRLVTLWTAS